MSEQMAFARKASGLVRGLSVVDAFGVGFMNQGLTPEHVGDDQPGIRSLYRGKFNTRNDYLGSPLRNWFSTCVGNPRWEYATQRWGIHL